MTNATNLNLTDFSDAFKERFEGTMQMQYNNSNVVWAKIKKSYSFVGKKDYRSLELSGGGGFASGATLPTVSYDGAQLDQAEITAKQVFSLAEIDHQAMKAGKNSEGFFDMSSMKFVAKKAVEVLNRNMQRILYGNADGKLYTGNASNSNVSGTGTACDPYIVPVNGALADLIFANFEEGDLVNVKTETTNLSVLKVVTTAGSEAIHLVGTSTRLATLSTANPFTTTDYFCAQASLNNDPQGLEILSKTSSTTYNVAHTNRRFQGSVIACSSAGVSEDLLNQLVLTIEEKCGKTPDLIVSSYYQFRKIKDFMSDHKRMEVSPRDESLIGKVSFSALQFMSAAGAIPIVADRFIAKDRVYAINTDHIEAIHRPDWGWLDEGEGIFVRRDTINRYQGRYGGYLQIFIEPAFHGYLDGLAIA